MAGVPKQQMKRVAQAYRAVCKLPLLYAFTLCTQSAQDTGSEQDTQWPMCDIKNHTQLPNWKVICEPIPEHG